VIVIVRIERRVAEFLPAKGEEKKDDVAGSYSALETILPLRLRAAANSINSPAIRT
jgi:hypothetical protein